MKILKMSDELYFNILKQLDKRTLCKLLTENTIDNNLKDEDLDIVPTEPIPPPIRKSY